MVQQTGRCMHFSPSLNHKHKLSHWLTPEETLSRFECEELSSSLTSSREIDRWDSCRAVRRCQRWPESPQRSGTTCQWWNRGNTNAANYGGKWENGNQKIAWPDIQKINKSMLHAQNWWQPQRLKNEAKVPKTAVLQVSTRGWLQKHVNPYLPPC